MLFRSYNRVSVEDTTINLFEDSINRLNESLISVANSSNETEQRIGVKNPSINDFLFSYLKTNDLEIENMIENSLYFEQIDKLVTCTNNKLISQIKCGLLNKLKTFNKQIFSNSPMYHQTPKYIYILQILLIHLDENELFLSDINKKDFEDFQNKYFSNHEKDRKSVV